MRSLAFGKAMKQLPFDSKPQALVFQSCRLWQEARDSGFQELQQLNLEPDPHQLGQTACFSPVVPEGVQKGHQRGRVHKSQSAANARGSDLTLITAIIILLLLLLLLLITTIDYY